MKFRFFLAILVALLPVSPICAQEGNETPDAPEKLDEIPARLFQVQDAAGFFWQAAGNGALTSGETQYLQSGLNLIVAGEPFSPGRAMVRAPGETGDPVDVQFEERREGYVITRNLWFDLDRSAVRVLDTVQNTGSVAQTVSLQWRTTFPFPWQSLHGSSGDLLSAQPALALAENDVGMVIHFSQSEGRHDTVLLLGGESGEPPELNASSNSRELTISRDLIVQPGGSRSVLHWVMQRNLPELSEAQSAFSPIYQRTKLIIPGVSEKEAADIVNFPPEAFPSSGVSPNLRNLFSLNAIVNAIGLHRRGEDILWVSNTNQLTCEVDRTASIQVASALLGDITVPVSELAAVLGSAGSGRKTFLFLRDGQVLTGDMKEDGISATTSGSKSESLLKFSEINLLLFSVSSNDGEPPSGASHFVETLNGEVVAVTGSGDVVWNVATPWGRQEIPFSDISEVDYTSAPFPGHRMLVNDGTMLEVFSASEALPLVSSNGQALDLRAPTVRRVWRAGAQKRGLSEQSEEWVTFSEIPAGIDSGASFLLAGNNLLAGSLDGRSIELVENGTRVRLEGENIAAINRMHSTPVGGEPQFEVKLSNGDRLRGSIASSAVFIDHPYGTLNVPTATLLSYRRPLETP